MTYDPTHSRTFSSIVHANPDLANDPDNQIWKDALEVSAQYMDDDIRESIHVNPPTAPGALNWLLAYMEAHEKHFGSHFEWS